MRKRSTLHLCNEAGLSNSFNKQQKPSEALSVCSHWGRICYTLNCETVNLRVRVSEKNNSRSSAQIPHQQEQVKWQQQSSCKRDNKHQLHRAVWRCLWSTREAALLHLTKGRTGGERNLLTPRPPLMNMPNNRKTVLLNSGQPTVQLGPKNFYSKNEVFRVYSCRFQEGISIRLLATTTTGFIKCGQVLWFPLKWRNTLPCL